MGIVNDIATGFALTGLTSMFEEIERTRATHFIGAGGGFDSLPLHRQAALQRKIPQWLERLRRHPPARITREVLKNYELARGLGREERMHAQRRLLGWLVEQGVAVDVEQEPSTRGAGEELPPSPKRSLGEPTRRGMPTHRLVIGPAMPRLETAYADAEFRMGPLFVVFFVAPPTMVSLPVGMEAPFSYLYAGAIFSEELEGITSIYALEQSSTGDVHFCMFEFPGVHTNLGDGQQLIEKAAFQAAVLARVREATGIDEQVQRISG